MTNRHRRVGERGNVFVFVLLGVVLFAALAFTFMRSAQQGTGNLSSQQLKIAAGDILSYAQQMEQSVSRLRAKRISESSLDFENTSVTGYTNAGCADDTCEIFDPAGGRMVWQSPSTGVNDGSEWVISGALRINGVGTSNLAATASDLVLVLPNVDRDLCVELNNRLGVTNPSDAPPVATANAGYSTKFTGSFSLGDVLTSSQTDGKSAGCFTGSGTPASGTYHFYQVLVAR